MKYQAQSSKWKIENIKPISSKQTGSIDEMEAHVIALIIIGIAIGLVLIFGLVLFLRLKRVYVFYFSYVSRHSLGKKFCQQLQFVF